MSPTTPTALARPDRPARPPAPPLPAFETLDRAHREMLAKLGEFERLLGHVDEHGPDDEARRIAANLLAFFAEQAHEHHAQEERVVFPPLLADADSELAAHVRRLQQDHGWLEEDWLLLAPQLEGIARGYNWYDLPMLRVALPIFQRLYREHIGLEESLVYPAAKRRLQALEAGEAARRDAG